MRFFFLFFLSVIFFFTACKENSSIETSPNARLFFSTDSVLFDTIFTSKSSTTRAIKIFNYNKSKILVDELSLAGGDNSNFKININGLTTNKLSGIEIPGNDSIYVFIKASIDPNSSDSPFLVEDSLLLTYNQKTKKLPLVAYGQNAIYINNQTLTGNIILKKGKPYVLSGSNILSENANLELEAGTRMYFHKKAKLVLNGNLRANGTLKDSIVFASDRTERIYRDEPGQWEGIYISDTSKENIMNYCIIKNAITGIYIDSSKLETHPKLLLTNSIIKNHQVAGVIADNSVVVGINNLLFNCGRHLLAILNGGRFEFYQNTFAGYNFSLSRTTPSISVSNGKNTDLTASFINNIIWGNNRNELELKKNGNRNFDVLFKSNLIKTTDTEAVFGNNNTFNTDPIFLNTRHYLFWLSIESPFAKSGEAIKSTLYSDFIKTDLAGLDRIFPSTLGCFEKK
ncbi:hypothetical protein Pedsa_3261 [Pseudopedobacter saltans DSM 12145]|uniref:Right handed beta helix domain-containing protein n=1 Tax=Pseudopedobacter saltans (strain ATCC 51119 / DSM 12145 / JCM 21818 / CCUG 39354 / LMG 10337 / NBRC 100064 / NCIMB 13643) TaxID=762903 RepID=F0SBV5_PSESL|nr:right-handed parallel beta-helix repeat-containing protein [Pseudopedobacter saltans]ADY53796.1 hypothetical protein Pedsa_3261 [Pseudopedobacter saltans DSM 12145]